VPKKAVTLLVVVILVYAMVRDPTGSASLVSRGISGLTQGAGALIDGFFTFINALIP
jgi:hypothetical protein